jgi:hypothetical protein
MCSVVEKYVDRKTAANGQTRPRRPQVGSGIKEIQGGANADQRRMTTKVPH